MNPPYRPGACGLVLVAGGLGVAVPAGALTTTVRADHGARIDVAVRITTAAFPPLKVAGGKSSMPIITHLLMVAFHRTANSPILASTPASCGRTLAATAS